MKLKIFSSKLISWYKKNARDLPWRETRNPYKIWVSEIMLQQTTVNAVIPYYKKWINKFPTIASVAKAREQTILNYWQGLGYYNRAKNLHKTAKIIIKDFNGKLPENEMELKKLPGFGDYTIGAVLSIAFGKKIKIIDANVRRVIMRLLSLEGKASLAHDKTVGQFLDQHLPNNEISEFNQGLMELGALICKNQNPLCLQCPFKSDCLSYKNGNQEMIPLKVKKQILELDVSIGILKKGSKVLIQKRASKGVMADLWEFPGGKIEDGETKIKALKRELKEELGIEVLSQSSFTKVKHYYTQFKVNLHCFICSKFTEPAIHSTRKWCNIKDLHKYPMPSGSAKIVDLLTQK